jgi:hypothetical protein
MKGIWSIVIIPLYLLVSCSSSKAPVISEHEVNLQPTFSEIAIDGRSDDWRNAPHDFSEGSTVEFSVANNASHLFILLKVPSIQEQRKILEGGMDVWISADGRKDKKTGITYPVKGELSDQDPSITGTGQLTVKERHLQMAAQVISMQRFGFIPVFNSVQSIRQNTGFKASIGWDENDVMIYELTIPFNAFTEDIRNKELKVGFNIHGIDRTKNSQQAQNNAFTEGHGSSMGGGRRGGGNFGNRRDPGQKAANNRYNQHEKMYAPETFWADYRIANAH